MTTILPRRPVLLAMALALCTVSATVRAQSAGPLRVILAPTRCSWQGWRWLALPLGARAPEGEPTG